MSFTLKPSLTSHDDDSEVLFGELALLPGHRRVSPDNVYYYAVAHANTKIQGIVIYNVPASAMADIDKYIHIITIYIFD